MPFFSTTLRWKCVWSGPRLRSNESPSGAFKRRAVCVSRWRGLAPTSSAGRDKREIKNNFPLNMPRAQRRAFQIVRP